MGTTYTGLKNGTSFIPTIAKPIDPRTVVDSIDDLTNGSIPQLYQGLVVNIKATGDLYVLTTAPRLAKNLSSWVKVGGSADIDLSNYATLDDLVEFLTASDVEDYVKVEDLENYLPKEVLDDLATKSDLEGYVKTEDAVDFLTSSELEGYVRLEDLTEFLTASDLDDYAKKSDIPTNVSAFINDAGYLTSTNLRIPAEWNINGSMRDLIDDINDDITATPGKVYLGTIHLNDLPYSEDETWSGRRLIQGEARIEIMASQGDTGKVINFTLTSTLKPYHWEYTSSWRNEGEWISFLTEHQDISGKADKEEIPTKVSELTNDEGYLKLNDLPAFLMDSDLEDYVKVEELENYLPKEVLDELASKSDLEGYIRVDDAVEFLTASDLDDYLRVSELPTNVSAFINDAGYLTSNDLPDYLMDSDLDGFATETWVEEQGYLKEHQSLEDYAQKSELPTNVSDLLNDAGYITENDLPDFLMDSDLDGYVKVEDLAPYLKAEDIEDLASKSDLEGYVKTEDAIEFLTGSDLDDYLRVSELPTNVSAFINDAGYLTSNDLPDFLMDSDLDGIATESWVEEQGYLKATDLPDFLLESDIEDFATKSDLEDYLKSNDLPINVSDFINDAGYITEHQDLSDYALKNELPVEGMFPDVDGSDASDSGVDGYATVDGVVAYVQAMFEKMNEDNDRRRYAFISGFAIDGESTDITTFNKFLLNNSGDTVIEVFSPVEIARWDPVTNEDLPSLKMNVDIPVGYVLKEAYLWNEHLDEYELLNNDSRAFGVNPVHATVVRDGITYNSYVRGEVDDIAATTTIEKYKIIITKQ